MSHRIRQVYGYMKGRYRSALQTIQHCLKYENKVNENKVLSYCKTIRYIRYCLSKVNIWNVNCVLATSFIFDTRTGVLVKVSTPLRQKVSRRWIEPPTFGFMPNAGTIWAIRARHLLPHVFGHLKKLVISKYIIQPVSVNKHSLCCPIFLLLCYIAWLIHVYYLYSVGLLNSHCANHA